VQAETGATFVPPYDSVRTILGQGTVFLELESQAKELGGRLDAVVAPVGGGGLLAGIALAAQGSGVKVFGAEPAGASDCAEGIKKGERIPTLVADTIADGLRTVTTQTLGLFPIFDQRFFLRLRKIYSTPAGGKDQLPNHPATRPRNHSRHRRRDHRSSSTPLGTHEARRGAQRRGRICRCQERAVQEIGRQG
jgi:hypothetical protein